MQTTLHWIKTTERKPDYGKWVYVSDHGHNISQMFLKRSESNQWDVWCESIHQTWGQMQDILYSHWAEIPTVE